MYQNGISAARSLRSSTTTPRPVPLVVIRLTQSASSVYIETTIPSYLTAWRSPELSMAAKQQTTRKWWDERREQFDLFISEAVLLEASSGDSDAVKRRLEVLDGIPILSPKLEPMNLLLC